MTSRAFATWVASVSKWFGLAAMAMAATSCVTALSSQGELDHRTVSVEFFDMFNQRLPESAENPWRGDWYFRRLRLALIDEGLRNARPDVLIMQGAMNRYASIVESDDEILGSGALKGYAWDLIKVNDYEDSFESENHMVAVGLPLTVKRDTPSSERIWRVNEQDFFTLSILEIEDHPFAFFTMEMHSEQNIPAMTALLKEAYDKLLVAHPDLCRDRVMVLGRINGLTNFKPFRDWIESNGLKDASSGFCENAVQCFTAEMSNELFTTTEPQLPSGQYDRIYAPASASIYSSRRTQSVAAPLEAKALKNFGLTQLWSTAHFGWNVTLRMRRCH